MTDDEVLSLKKIEDEVLSLKKIEFYAATVNAWYNTRFELDKSLLTLSSAGIGLLITLSTVSDFKFTCGLLFSYVLALISFVFSLVVLLVIFRKNSNSLENVAGEKKFDAEDGILKKLDLVVWCSFGVGVLFSCVFGALIAINKSI